MRDQCEINDEIWPFRCSNGWGKDAFVSIAEPDNFAYPHSYVPGTDLATVSAVGCTPVCEAASTKIPGSRGPQPNVQYPR